MSRYFLRSSLLSFLFVFQQVHAQKLVSLAFESFLGDYELEATVDLPDNGGRLTILAEYFIETSKKPEENKTEYRFIAQEDFNNVRYTFSGTLTMMPKEEPCIGRIATYEKDDEKACVWAEIQPESVLWKITTLPEVQYHPDRNQMRRGRN